MEDLTEDIVAGRVFESYESYYPQPYIQLSVLYPDNTVIGFSGQWEPAELYRLLTSLPSTAVSSAIPAPYMRQSYAL